MANNMIKKRTVSVDNIQVATVTFSGIFQIGDANLATPVARAISVQQTAAVFFPRREPDYNHFPIFSRPSNRLQTENHVTKITHQNHDNIRVGNIDIHGISQSAIAQIGSLKDVTAESRLLHIRRSFIL